MARILISLLSDHIIPNYLFIKETEGQFDELVFISTEYVFSREIGVNMEKALGLTPRSVRRVVVSNENYFAIMRELRQAQFSHDDEYCINQTGGTKAMSIAVFQFFQDFNARFVYTPFDTNEYFDFSRKKGKKIKYRVCLDEYFTLHGLFYECNNNYLLDAKASERVFNALMLREFRLTDDILCAQQKPNAAERRFWLGEWFEEYVFRRIRSEYKSLNLKFVAKSVKIYRKGSVDADNEIDVAFMKDNKLHVIECKVGTQGPTMHANMDKYLYKLAAVTKDLGQNVFSYLFMIQPINRLQRETRANIRKRAEILGIKGIFDGPRLTEKLEI